MTSASASSRFTAIQWLVCIIAAIGFLFDTYELLMTPLVGVPAIADLLQLPPNHPEVTQWMGRMLWITALCGGTFGLAGGWLIDRFGRKRIMALSIFVYSFSPACAAMSTSLGGFIFFRSTTFIGVCVEFVAAITWLAELFSDKRQREIVLGSTQAFASLGGILVTAINAWVVTHAASLPVIAAGHATWRYTLLTGLLPAIPIAILLPFVPESQVWRERRQAGTLQRPSFRELFSPALRRATWVTALLSACAYGAAFGALQLTPLRVAPGLPDLAPQRAALKPLTAEAASLNQQLTAALPAFEKAKADVVGLGVLAEQRKETRIAQRAARRASENPKASEEEKAAAKAQLAALGKKFGEYDAELDRLTASAPDAKKAVLEREKVLKALGDNREQQEPHDIIVKQRGNKTQFIQEMGGLVGRILLAVLIFFAVGRRLLLRLFILPGLIVFPLTYFSLFHRSVDSFLSVYFICGLLVVAQFSYFGEFLPKVFPLHLRGTGGSFATNVGGRMIGTSMAFVTTNVVAYWFSDKPGFAEIAKAAGIVGTTMFVIALIVSFFLPEAKEAAEKSAPSDTNYRIS